ncbi:MAG: mandelate racemase/muconate lactonizing enzyme family protein [Planctomycetota bacterium]|nr:mandelate racemase/muconate lactonizing enzyme family protein [Planctomycetota bacterium]
MRAEGSNQEPRQRGRTVDRRAFLGGAGLGGLSLAWLMSAPPEEQVAYASQDVNRRSRPSALKITDLRIAEIVRAPMRVPILRIDTNQGISGHGEVRDGGSKRYALFLKSRLLGENPCNVEKIFKKIKQFGHHGRQGGGVSGVEMALWDLAGKAYGVPVYQLLGGKYRDRVRLYTDTTSSRDPDEYAARMKARVAAGFTFLKMDVGIGLVRDVPGALTLPLGFDWNTYRTKKHPFTRIQLTEKGIERLVEYVARVREAVGYEVPLAADHFGHIGVNSCIRLGRALTRYQLAWLEDLVPWQYTEMWKQITRAIDVPTLTGEDIYLKEAFIKLIDARAVDMVHPDLATAGGILETKKIGDYAEERGVAMAMHFAGSPVSFMANVHCAAATQNFVALEHHSVDVPWWEDLVTGVEKPLHRNGFVRVPETPGLGVELNEETVRQHLGPGEGYFEPTPEWNEKRSNDRLWS